MNWMKKVVSMGLTVLILTSMMVGASAVHYLPDVSASMAEVAFWTQNSEILMSTQDALLCNGETIAAAGTNMYDLKNHPETVDGISLNEGLKKSAQADAKYYLGWTYLEKQQLATQAEFDAIIENTQNPNATAQQVVRYGIAVKRTALRAFPSSLAIWDDLNDTDFDYQYLVGVRVGEPVVITSVSKDGNYYLAKSICCSGWIPVEDVAICSDKTQWLEAWDIAPENILVVWGDKVYTESSVVGAQTSETMLTMGTVLELAENIDPNRLIDNRATYNNHVVWMPVRAEDGSYAKKLTLISQHHAVSEGYLPLTEQNIAKLALSALGNVYGWGGSLNSEDCSSYIRNIYKCFGLELARNTTWQTAMPMAKVDMRNMCCEERLATLDALPLGTILFFNGHEMLYLGKEVGNYYVISAVGSVIQPGSNSTKQRIRSVILNTLQLKRANGKTWLDELTDAVVPYWQPNAPQLPQKAWYHDGVAYCLQNGLMQGDEDKMFRPADKITWAELLQILLNAEPTKDETVQDSSVNWYDAAVNWAKTKALISPEDLSFDPAEPMTRQQLATVLYHWAQYRQMDVSVGEDINILSYDDVGEIAEYAMPAMQYAAGAGLLKGKTEHTLNPLGDVTRAETAVVLQRLLQNTAEG